MGVFLFFIIIWSQYGGLSAISNTLQEHRSDFWMPPDWNAKRIWFSTILVVAIGVSVYPHAIQRIYAAKSAIALRRSFQLMIFMPFFTTLFMIIVGIVGASQFQDLNRIESEQISIILLTDLAQSNPAVNWLLIILTTYMY